MDDIGNMEIAVTEEQKGLKEYQAFYYMFNAKPDTATRVFPDHVKLNLDDIIELNNLVVEKIGLHSIDVVICSIAISFENRKSVAFENWETFQNYKWNEPSCVKNIILSWDFAVNLKQYENPHRHKLKVKLSAGLSPEEILNLVLTGKIENMEELDMDEFPIVAQMDYIDNQLCNEFLNLVGSWVDNLSKATDNSSKIMLVLKKHRALVAKYFNYMLTVILLVLGFVFINYYMFEYKNIVLSEIEFGQILKLCNCFGILLFSILLVYAFSVNIAKSVFKKLCDYNRFYIFDITRKDNERQKEVLKENRKIRNNIFVKGTFSLISNIVFAIITTLILNKIGL